jgi:hypothetical protein
LVYAGRLVTPPEGVFINRNDEVALIAECCLCNYMFRDPSSFNTILCIATQMYGSGKTFLGKHFLHSLRSKLDLVADLKMKFRAADVEVLLQSVYLYKLPLFSKIAFDPFLYMSNWIYVIVCHIV